LDSVGIAEAREKASQWRKTAKEGRDPSEEAKRLNAIMPTFTEAAEAYHESRKGSWKNGKHADQWINTLRTYAYPAIGKLTVDRIDAPEIQSVLIPIWQSKAETAVRVRQRIGTVLDHCKAMGWRDTEAPMRAVNTLLKGLKQPKKGNFAALRYKAVPAFMAKLKAKQPTAGNLALQFLILTAARSGEVRGAAWSEIDFERALWTIPAERMKMGQEHQVPLPPAAITILEAAKGELIIQPDRIIFPGLKRQALSDMTLGKVLKSNGGDGYTVHGFRSSFRDWCAESGFNNDWAEAALAHSVPNRVEAAYRRTKFLEQRRGLMVEWAVFCGTPRL
jgi:integrase